MLGITNKWRLAFVHAWPSAKGVVRLLFEQPVWMIGFLVVRARYFFTRKLKCEIRTPDGFLIQTPCELISYWSFFVEHECWSSDWDEELQREVQPLILDVGANAGLFTHWIWTKNRKAEFIVFEPLPLMAAKIRAWGAQTGARISLNQVAVSDHCGEAKFYTDADNDTGASLRNDRYRKNEFVVPVLTLDSAVSQRSVFLIKIDVEGCETEVLRGATRTLKNARFLLIEAHTSEALARICNILPASQWVCQRVGSSDYLFRRQA